jgi:hypothetical protein
MVFVKAAFAGIAASFVAAVATVVAVIALMFASSRNVPDGQPTTIGWDPIAFLHSPLSWLILGGAFVLGFAWEFRRAG